MAEQQGRKRGASPPPRRDGHLPTIELGEHHLWRAFVQEGRLARDANQEPHARELIDEFVDQALAAAPVPEGWISRRSSPGASRRSTRR
jgi:hypothetical protein